MSKEVKRYSYGYVDDGNGNRYLGLIEKPDGNLVKHEDYEALLAERDELNRWKQTAEYWYGQYRLAKYGETPADHPVEGALDAWHNSYHGAQP